MGALALPLIQSLIEKLGSDAWKELRLGWGIKEEVDKLRILLLTINPVLGDAEKRSIGDGALRMWLKELKDAAYDADDVLDEFQTKALQRRLNTSAPVISKVNPLLFKPYKSISMAHKVETILKKFKKLAEEKNSFHLAETPYIPLSHPNRETYSLINEDEIFGRENDKRELVEWLINDDNVSDVSILPVVGLGGLGKTTLAQLVYNDTNVTDHFHIKKWVCVGETFEVNKIVKDIIGSDKNSKLEEMLEELRKKFGNKKYLLIIDDVWNEEALRWEELKKYLKAGMGGSKIIVTTRSQRVAEIMGTVYPYKLEVLSNDHCWMLFKKRAFGPGREDENQNLVQIGLEIVKKCGGLPLAAKSIGSLMATKHGENEWRDVKDSEFWMIENSLDGIVPALRVSFDHLPPQLKQCFAYCLLFPKDFELNKIELIQLWIAEGFIGSEESACLEDIGEEYFNSLLLRSFFQEERKDKFGKIESCKMHDLIHDLGCSVTADESSTLGSKSNYHLGCRRVSLFGSSSNKIRIVANEARKLRSLFIFGDEQFRELFHAEDLEFALSKLIHLRVLYLNSIPIKRLRSSIGKLKHLRFLNLSGNYFITSLPDSITNLYNLQVLNIQGCSRLHELPKGMKKMSNLRHFFFDRLVSMPSGMGKLTNLQTLSLFKVGNKPDQLSIVELQPLKQIRGSLKITGLRNVKNPKDAAKAELVTIENLQSLYLHFGDNNETRRRQILRWPASGDDTNVDDDDDLTVDDILIENLKPHPNLKELEIDYYNYNGSRLLPNWLTFAMLPNLVKLTLTNISRCESLPAALGQFHFLKELTIESFHNLKRIGAELFGETSTATFPLLKSLWLYFMEDLEEWSIIPKTEGEMMMFPVLERLNIKGCPKLRIQPSLPSSILNLWLESSNELLLAAADEEGGGGFGCLQGLSSLTELTIRDMEASNMGESWKGLQYLTNLQKLNIWDCQGLESLPEGIMQLHIPSLRTLRLSYNPHMKYIIRVGELEEEEQQQQPPPPFFMSLHHLQISYCFELIVLPGWLGGLTSLQTLYLKYCPKLQMLPDGLQHLTGLNQLTIESCPILEGRCKADVGEDWHKIAHIPNLQVIASGRAAITE